jgi:phosphate transport system substrate-binding protein
MYTDAVGTTWRRRLGRARVMGIATVVLATALGLGAIVATPGGAATSHTSTQAEAALASLEALAPSSPTTLTEAGSSLFYPLWEEWAAATPPVPVTPGKGGSGLGQSEAVNGTINIGGSDGFLPLATMTGPPAMLNIPVVVSAQAVVYNLHSIPAGKHLQLSSAVLDGIYSGKIKRWNSKLIAALNPRVKLPNKPIIPVRRVDSSGDTFIFTSYLYYGDRTSWTRQSPYDGPQLIYSAWPYVDNELAVSGNSGIEAAVQANPGAIGYLGISYLPSAAFGSPPLGYAALENGSNHFVLPTPGAIEAEVAAYPNIPADGAISLIDSHKAPNGYPIVNFEYAIVQENQPNVKTEDEVKAELAWAMDPQHGATATFLNPVDMRPLPPNALNASINLLNEIS